MLNLQKFSDIVQTKWSEMIDTMKRIVDTCNNSFNDLGLKVKTFLIGVVIIACLIILLKVLFKCTDMALRCRNLSSCCHQKYSHQEDVAEIKINEVPPYSEKDN
ncbi:alpha1 protein [Yata virus]|uniref:Alpha1 protein n=1 Tax=Yata virus TaxID=1272960 RepID=A0A096ZGU5_9RHAB|nr:alpha1 protein [Yata virus]AIR95574.1 alpha1 protein [Yata virus]